MGATSYTYPYMIGKLILIWWKNHLPRKKLEDLLSEEQFYVKLETYTHQNLGQWTSQKKTPQKRCYAQNDEKKIEWMVRKFGVRVFPLISL